MPRDVSDDNLPHAFCVLVLQIEKREKGGEGGKSWWGEEVKRQINRLAWKMSLEGGGLSVVAGTTKASGLVPSIGHAPPGRLLLLGRRTWWCSVGMRAVEGGC